MASKNVLITTTSSIDGHKIDQYKGVISARVVTGTGLFSDWAASFSDMFGGRSNSYNSQLKSIYDEVISQLEAEAKKVGANLILGFKIDHDEISGKGKQMFMVTATGTAANSNSITLVEETTENEVVLEKFTYELNRQRLIHSVTRNPDELHSKWDYIVQERVHEVMEVVFKHYLSYDGYVEDDVMKNSPQYFSEIEEHSKSYLYENLANVKGTQRVAKLIVDANLVDYERVISLLNSESMPLQKCGLRLLSGKKKRYSPSDIDTLEAIDQLISNNFKQQGKNIDSDKWECRCGKVNKTSATYCKSCDHDIMGFLQNEVSSEYAKAAARETRYVLKLIFKV
ncbi:YbjQ family protein [Cohnella panacarvi]|uniref:YbjQ family protein n=1 Tax=Cohnella panacarvi TaxID=400776 RepID=UPI00047E7BEB|nr:YbjQ family protein [Cohnella panacarvi]